MSEATEPTRPGPEPEAEPSVPAVAAADGDPMQPVGEVRPAEERVADPSTTSAWMDVLILLALALCLRVATWGWLHCWSSDEFFYTVLARDFYDAARGTYQGPPLRWQDSLHTCGFAYVVSWVFRAVDDASLEIARAVGLWFNALTVPLAYLLARLCGARRGRSLGAAALLATWPAFWGDADRAWADHQAAFLTTLLLVLVFWAWQRGSRLTWAAACATWAALALTKEYVALLVLPAVGVGLVIQLRRQTWTFWATGLGLFALAVLSVWWIQFRSGWTPHASYLETLLGGVSAQRQEYFGLSRPDFHKLYIQNLFDTDLPGAFLAVSLVGAVLLLWRTERPAETVGLGVLAATFVLYLSCLRNVYGARLLFPIFPALALATAAGLRPTGSPFPALGLILLAYLGFPRWRQWQYVFEPWRQTALLGFLAAVVVAYLLAALVRGGRRPAVRRAAEPAARLLFVLLVGMSLVLNGVFIQHRARASPPRRMWAAQSWIQGHFRPTDGILSANPRSLAYFSGQNFHQMGSSAWWGREPDQIERAYLEKHHLRWVVMTWPEFQDRYAAWILRVLRRRPYLRERYHLTQDRMMLWAIFEVSLPPANGRADSDPP